MIPSDELVALYKQWHGLTEDEGEAIEAGAWTNVEHFQAAKAGLQPRIVELSRRLDVTTHEHHFRPIVEELMQLERHNDDMVKRWRQATDQQMRELDKASRRLRQLHKSYVPPARTHWQSYS